MKAAGSILAIAVALAIQTTLARFLVRGTVAVDLVLVAVVYVALTSGPVTGMLVAETVLKGETPPELRPFDPLR